MSQEHTRARERHAGKMRYMLVSHAPTPTQRRRADVYYEDHTLSCTIGSLSVEGTTVLPLGVCTRKKNK